MKIKKYIELEKTFHDKSFEGKYGLLDKVLDIASYLGNLASIFFAYWFLSKLMYRAISEFPGREIGVAFLSIISLGIFELLKRFVLKGFSLAVIQSKKINTEVIYTFVFSVILLTGSFYLSLSGAKIFSDKREEIQQQVEIVTSAQEDSINTIYAGKIAYKLKDREDLRKNKNIYVDKLAEVGNNTTRLKQFNDLIKGVNDEIKRVDVEIDSLKVNNKRDIESINKKLKNSSDDQIVQISKNQVAFIIISSFIELLILVGIWFHSFFRLKVYDEYRQNLENNTNYEMYRDYSKMLSMMYRNGKVQPQTELPAMTSFMEIVKKKEGFSHNYMRDFTTICKDLGIITVNQKKKNIVLKKYQEAKDLLIDYFEEE